MSELSGGNKTVSILVKVTQTLDKVVGSVRGSSFADGLINWQENFEAYSLVRFVLMREFLDIRLGGILVERSKRVAYLSNMNFSIPATVEQLKSFLKFYTRTKIRL